MCMCVYLYINAKPGGRSGACIWLLRHGFSGRDSVFLLVSVLHLCKSRLWVLLDVICSASGPNSGSPGPSKIVILLRTSFKNQVFAQRSCSKLSKTLVLASWLRWRQFWAPPGGPKEASHQCCSAKKSVCLLVSAVHRCNTDFGVLLEVIWSASGSNYGFRGPSKIVILLQTSFKNQVFVQPSCRTLSKASVLASSLRWKHILAAPGSPQGVSL